MLEELELRKINPEAASRNIKTLFAAKPQIAVRESVG